MVVLLVATLYATLFSLAKQQAGESAFQAGGHFGDWVTDANDQPLYVYTCDQYHDPIALSWPAPNPADRSDKEHVFQLGNSRITLLVRASPHSDLLLPILR